MQVIVSTGNGNKEIVAKETENVGLKVDVWKEWKKQIVILILKSFCLFLRNGYIFMKKSNK